MGPLDDKTTPLRANLLLVDDQPAGLREVADLLAELDQNLVQALSTDEAFQRLREEEFAVVLLHVPMRGVDAFETARQIRSGEKSLATPIIFLADQESPELPPARAYTLGAVDFLMKPLVPEILRAKVAGLVDLFHKTKHCAGQADRLRRLERQEHERRLTEELARQNEEERARLLAQAEQARAEAEQQRDFARLILEQTPIAVSVSEGPEHRLVLVNRAAAGLFGLPPEDFLGRTPADWGYEASEKVVPLLDQVYHSGKTAVLPELTISLPRKGTLCLHMTYVPLLGAGGRPMGVLHLGLDLTKRKKVEEERKKLLHQLEAERALLEAVLQQMPGGVLIAEAPSGKVLLRNQSGAIPAILAAPLPASLEDYARFQQTFPDPRYASYRQWPLLRALLQGEVVAEEEMAYRNPDGTRGTLRANAAPIRDREGRIVAAVTTFFDVTERKRAEEALRFLDEASKVLASSLDYSTTLVSVAHLVVPRLADWCTVHIVEEDGSTRQLAVAHADPARAAWARELEQRYPPDPNGPSGVQEVLRTGRPTLVEDIPQEMVDAGARDAEHREI
ncbi:MAG: PAS domain-containing protein, partial [Planctomycetes bacterium]|nr:PAS domain-containing protein [Planctomycetota bacterium]